MINDINLTRKFYDKIRMNNEIYEYPNLKYKYTKIIQWQTGRK